MENCIEIYIKIYDGFSFKIRENDKQIVLLKVDKVIRFCLLT